MRWVFLFVFSLNLVYIGWEMSRSSSDDHTDVPALKNVQTIVLLSELKQQQTDSTKAGGKSEATIVDNTSTENLSVKQAGSEQVSAKLPDIAENGVAKTAANARQATPAEVPTAKLSQRASCFTLGPFRDLDKLRGLTREIKSYVVEADFRGREEKEQTLYWVYIKPEKSHTKAVETGKRLKAKKIKDFYVIRDGEKINGLSLGHFRNKDGAYGLVKKVKKLGFNVMVEPVFKTYTIYWLDYQLASGVKIPESIFEKHVKQTKKDKISRLSRDCDA